MPTPTPPKPAILIILALVLLVPTAWAQIEEDLILETAQNVMTGINTGDEALIRSAMLPGSILVSTGNTDGVATTRVTTTEEFASGVGSLPADYHERIFEYEIHIQKGVAVLWAQYDFHINGTFSHCGVDTFTLVKSPEGWKVASLAYTVEQDGCKERPPIPENRP